MTTILAAAGIAFALGILVVDRRPVRRLVDVPITLAITTGILATLTAEWWLLAWAFGS